MFTSTSTLAAVLLLAASGMASPIHHHHASATGTTTAAISGSTGTGSSAAAPQKDGGLWKVEGAGSFSQHADFDFTKLTALPKGLSVSPDHIGASGAGKAQQYSASNVYVRDGVLNMKVPGGQAGAETISGSQIATDVKLLYGSVRTVAKVSKVGGTCSGFFSYNNNNLQESDIEILTSNLTAIHYTNQNPNYSRDGGARSATKDGPIPSDATSAFHEYRLDWLPGKVRFYLDGKFQTEIDQYAPTAATPWVWNNWSNGDKEWSAGPPDADNVLEIQKIEMFYNSTSAATESDN